MPDRGAGQAGLRVGELLPGEPECVEPGDGLGVFVPVRAPGTARADLPAVHRQEEVVHPVAEGSEFDGIFLAAQGEDEHRGGAVGLLPVSRLASGAPSGGWMAPGVGLGAEAVEDDAVLPDLGHGLGEGAGEVVEVCVGDAVRLGAGGGRAGVGHGGVLHL